MAHYASDYELFASEATAHKRGAVRGSASLLGGTARILPKVGGTALLQPLTESGGMEGVRIRVLPNAVQKSRAERRTREKLSWKQAVIAWSLLVGLGIGGFFCVNAFTERTVLKKEQDALVQQLHDEQQIAIGLSAKLEQKFPLQVVQDTALYTYHMVPQANAGAQSSLASAEN